jgi:putative PIN family toxin of toxin-antitoxin system
MRVVIDSNVHVSAVIKEESNPGQIIKAWRGGFFELLISDSIMKEIEDVLHRDKIYKKYHLTEDRIKRALKVLELYTVKIPQKTTISVIKDDPSDNHVIECAVDGNADYIVSGDRHLLPSFSPKKWGHHF